uniref:Stearoyl-CoA desaturase n=2 Tax=Sus scrofa TaxID=9823 RepID=A0A8D0Y3W8_PIG
MPAHLLQEEISSSYTTTTTITAPSSRVLQNGGGKLEKTPQYVEEDIRPEMKDDIYDPTYQDKEGPRPKLEYVWRNIILMSLLHLGALYGIILIPTCKIYTLLWAFAYYLLSAVGVTAGAHRLWSHRTYKARLPLRVFLIIANTMAFQNDVYEWARDHRAHHKFSETDADPHNSRRGFFFSHVGWLLVRKHPAVKEKGGLLNMSDLKAEKLVMFQRRYYKPGILLMCFILPTIVPWYCWGEAFPQSLFVATFLRYAIVLNATWLVNSAAHLYGYRPYDKTISPRENILVSLGAVESFCLISLTPTPGFKLKELEARAVPSEPVETEEMWAPGLGLFLTFDCWCLIPWYLLPLEMVRASTTTTTPFPMTILPASTAGTST